MKEVILCKYGEIVLKGANRSSFEASLTRELKARASLYGSFRISTAQSTVYIEPQNDDCDLDGMTEAACRIFGIVAVSRAAVCEKTMESILATAKEYLPEKMFGVRTFKAEAKRSDKRFPLSSPEIAAQIGGAVLETVPHIRVDIHNPEGTGTSHYYFKAGEYYTIPYRSLIPRGASNMLVAGRCISSDHGAQASYRIMPVVCCIGEAAGTAVGLLVKNNASVRELDVSELQYTLKKNGAFVGI